MYLVGLLVMFTFGLVVGVVAGVLLWAGVSARARVRVTRVGHGMRVEVVEDSP